MCMRALEYGVLAQKCSNIGGLAALLKSMKKKVSTADSLLHPVTSAHLLCSCRKCSTSWTRVSSRITR